MRQKTARDWAAVYRNDTTASIVMGDIIYDMPSIETTEERSNSRVDLQEVKRFVSQGKSMELPKAEELLVRRCVPWPTIPTEIHDVTSSCSAKSRR